MLFQELQERALGHPAKRDEGWELCLIIMVDLWGLLQGAQFAWETWLLPALEFTRLGQGQSWGSLGSPVHG